MKITDVTYIVGIGAVAYIDALPEELSAGMHVQQEGRCWRIQGIETNCIPREAVIGKPAGLVLRGSAPINRGELVIERFDRNAHRKELENAAQRTEVLDDREIDQFEKMFDMPGTWDMANMRWRARRLAADLRATRQESNDFRDEAHPIARETRAEMARRNIQESRLRDDEVRALERKRDDVRFRAIRECISTLKDELGAWSNIPKDATAESVAHVRGYRAALDSMIERFTSKLGLSGWAFREEEIKEAHCLGHREGVRDVVDRIIADSVRQRREGNVRGEQLLFDVIRAVRDLSTPSSAAPAANETPPTIDAERLRADVTESTMARAFDLLASKRTMSAIDFLRKWKNDGADGGTTRDVCDVIEHARSILGTRVSFPRPKESEVSP